MRWGTMKRDTGGEIRMKLRYGQSSRGFRFDAFYHFHAGHPATICPGYGGPETGIALRTKGAASSNCQTKSLLFLSFVRVEIRVQATETSTIATWYLIHHLFRETMVPDFYMYEWIYRNGDATRKIHSFFSFFGKYARNRTLLYGYLGIKNCFSHRT